MYKAAVWGMGRDYNLYINSLKLQEVSGGMKIEGVTGKEHLYDYLDGYRYIER